MRRLPHLVTALVAFSLVATACGDEKERVAATVNGNDITVAEVADLAKTDFVASQLQQSGQGLVSSPPGTQGGARQRAALDFLVQAALYRDEVNQLGGRITDEDRQAGEARLASNEAQGGPMPANVRPMLVDYLASLSALTRLTQLANPSVVQDDETIAEISQFIANHPGELGSVTCVEAFAVPEANRDAAQSALDAGEPTEVILSNPELAAQPLSQDGSETCVLDGDVAQADLATLVFEGVIGRWDTLDLPGQTPEQSQVVFVRPNSRGLKAASSPAVVSVVNQVSSRLAFDKMLREADVTIDSRYGRWNPKQGTVVAPKAPTFGGDLTALDGSATTPS